MADCVTGFEYILNKDDDPEQVARNLLKQIDEKEGCKGLNKYEMALTIVRNDQQKMINIGADANTRRKLKKVSDTIVYEQEEKNKEARNFKQELSVSSSIASDNSSTQPQIGKPRMTEEEREAFRKANLAHYAAANKSAPKNKSTLRSIFGFGGNKTKKSKKGMSLCAKKIAKKCTKVRGCKVASGKKRTYCRKKKNHTKKLHKK